MLIYVSIKFIIIIAIKNEKKNVFRCQPSTKRRHHVINYNYINCYISLKQRNVITLSHILYLFTKK